MVKRFYRRKKTDLINPSEYISPKLGNPDISLVKRKIFIFINSPRAHAKRFTKEKLPRSLFRDYKRSRDLIFILRRWQSGGGQKIKEDHLGCKVGERVYRRLELPARIIKEKLSPF